MEQETMRAIREAEQAADQIEKDAAMQCQSIVADAKARAAKAAEEAAAAEKAEAAKALEAAREQGETLQKEALETVQQEIASLRTAAAAKSAGARELILAELF